MVDSGIGENGQASRTTQLNVNETLVHRLGEPAWWSTLQVINKLVTGGFLADNKDQGYIQVITNYPLVYD
jgi:hypothetical protein